MGTNLEPLSEEDFIENPTTRLVNRTSGIWPFIILTICCALWLGVSWLTGWVSQQTGLRPFLHVNNRDFSLFLWQNPQFMRVHAKKKTGYLTAFEYFDRIGLDPAYAEDDVVAPPQILFYYHTWDRLLKPEFSPRPIEPVEFSLFLEEVPEWTPKYWPAAPKPYLELVEKMASLAEGDIADRLPLDVQRAFQGWKNYFKEGSEINKVRPTFEEINAFLRDHPQYARPYWWNIVKASIPNYLLLEKTGSEEIPEETLSEFLKVAFFNDQAQNKLS